MKLRRIVHGKDWEKGCERESAPDACRLDWPEQIAQSGCRGDLLYVALLDEVAHATGSVVHVQAIERF